MSKKTLLNQISIGSWITLGHPAIAEIFAAAGFDWLAVDLEHSSITIREAEELIRIIQLKGVTPLVRLSSNNSEQIKRVMDAGAHGIIVPMVNSRKEAEEAVSAVKYPPTGTRSFGLARAQGYGQNFDNYVRWQSDNTLVVVQVEHIESVNVLDSILAVDGVDAYFVGPYDLSGSLGIPGQFQHPKYISAMNKIRQIGNDLKVPGGVHVVEPDWNQLKQCIEDGYKFIAYSLDVRMLDVACRNVLKKVSEIR
jgi:2-dehydro-3-deoxyglucarate aldolase